MTLTEKLIESGLSRLSAYSLEMTLMNLHTDLSKMTPYQRRKFWEVDIKERLMDLATERNLNTDLF